MSKFKVGDKVRCRVQEAERKRRTDYTHWAGLVVTEVDQDGYYACKASDGAVGGFYESTLEADKPKRDYVADHARRTLRKAGLTKADAAKFVRNLQEQNPSAISRYSRSLPKEFAAGSATDGFCWSYSPEGHDYWEERINPYDHCIKKGPHTNA